jgi:polyisoprenyl-phosphate glycosyltransferase
VRLAIDGITSFSTAPLRVASLLAVFGIALGGAIALYILVGFLTGRTIPGWTSQALIVVFFGTGQLACLAIIWAYLGRMYTQLKGRPLFLIDEITTSPGANEPAGAAIDGNRHESSRVR